jgi:hypothetical protein
MSIANQIQRLQNAKAALAVSIRNKGVEVPSATKLDGYAALVDQIQQGGGDTIIVNNNYYSDSATNIIGPDGSILAQYTPEELAALTALPSAPTYNGLTFAGWSMTLEELKASKQGDVMFARYTINDNCLLIAFQVPAGATVRLGTLTAGTVWGETGSGPYSDWTVDWGDNSTYTANLPRTTNFYELESSYSNGVHANLAKHTYQSAGTYLCKISTTGRMTVQAVTGAFPSEGGKGLVRGDTERYVKYIALPKDFAFWACNCGIPDGYSPECLFTTMPGGFVLVDDRWGENNNYPIGYQASQYGALQGANIYGITVRPNKSNFWIHMFTFSKLAAIYSPDGYMPAPTGYTGGGNSGNNWPALFNALELRTIPPIGKVSGEYYDSEEDVTHNWEVDKVIDKAFYNNRYLKHVVIQEGMTELGDNVFNCVNYGSLLEDVQLPSTITKIGAVPFAGTAAKVYLKATTPPTLSSASTIQMGNVHWYVPQESLQLYSEATNWSSLYSSGLVHGYNFNA